MKPRTDSPTPFVAVVTGSSSGIGRAIACEFASRGAKVLVHACTNLRGLAETVHLVSERSTLSDPSDCVRCMIGDLSSPPSVFEMARSAFAWHGHVNTWIHAAGADVLTGDASNWRFADKLQRLWEIDVYGTILLSRRVAVLMQQHPLPDGGLPSMLHLGWDQAEQGMEGDSGQYFSTVKAAVAAFSKSLAKSIAPHVRVNCIAPGWIQTEWGEGASEPWSRRAREESLLGRWGKAEDIAKFVAAISMGDGEFLNGQTISINGGWRGASDCVQSHMSHDSRPSLDPLRDS